MLKNKIYWSRLQNIVSSQFNRQDLHRQAGGDSIFLYKHTDAFGVAKLNVITTYRSQSLKNIILKDNDGANKPAFSTKIFFNALKIFEVFQAKIFSWKTVFQKLSL